MKKAIFNISILTCSCLLLTSCYNKQYDCYCTDTANQEFLETVVANSTKKADDKCKVLETSGKFSRTTICELK
jgi:hypothetical protein